MFSDTLAPSGGDVLTSVFLLHFGPLGVHPPLEKGEMESWVLVPTTSRDGTALYVEEKDDRFDEDVDIEKAIEDDA